MLVRYLVRWQSLAVFDQKMVWLKLEMFQCKASTFHGRLTKRSAIFRVQLMSKPQRARHVPLQHHLMHHSVEDCSNHLLTLWIENNNEFNCSFTKKLKNTEYYQKFLQTQSKVHHSTIAICSSWFSYYLRSNNFHLSFKWN